MRRLSVLACVLGVSVACGGSPAADTRAWTIRVEPTTLTTSGRSFEPQFTRHGDGAILSWVEQESSGATLKFSERTASGAWSAAQTAASGNDWFLSWADVPSVSRLADGTLVAQWLQTVDPLIEAYNLLLATSRDGGRTWSAPFSPHRDGTRTQHGFASLFPWPGGSGFGVIWLDGRDQELNTTDPAGGSMALISARYDGAGARVAETPVNLRVCECCSTSVAITADGPIAAFRDRSDTEVRDIQVSRFENGAWSAPSLVHADNWTLDACPVNGPVIAAEGSTVAVSWFAAKGDEGHAYAAFSRDGGRSFAAPIRLDDAVSLGHVGVEMLGDDAAVASWVEFSDGRARLRVRRVDVTGARSAPVEIAGAGTGRVSGHPRIARAGADLLFAWTESQTDDPEGPQQVRVATARLP